LSNDTYQANKEYTVNISVTIVINGFLAAVCALVGSQLFLLLRSRAVLHAQAQVILAVSMLMTVCLVIRIGLFIDRPLLNNNHNIRAAPFDIFAYFVPECIPLFAQMTLYYRRTVLLEANKMSEDSVNERFSHATKHSKTDKRSVPSNNRPPFIRNVLDNNFMGEGLLAGMDMDEDGGGGGGGGGGGDEDRQDDPWHPSRPASRRESSHHDSDSNNNNNLKRPAASSGASNSASQAVKKSVSALPLSQPDGEEETPYTSMD